MPLSKIQIALYSTLAIGVLAGLAFHIPHWTLIVLGLIVGLADFLLDRKPSAQSVRRGRVPRASGVEQWILLGVSVAFCVLALLIAGHDWRRAAVTIAIFGGCALVFFANIRRRRREKYWKAAIVRVVGGVNIYFDAPRMGLLAVGLCFVGCVIYFVGSDDPLLMRLVGAFIALVGVGLAITLALGFYSRRFIRFEPDCFMVGEHRYRLRIDWDNIASIFLLEYASNPFVGLQLRDVAAVSIEPTARIINFMRLVRNNRALADADVFIAPRNYGIDGPVLASALQRYALNPEARRELAVLHLPVHGG